MYREELPEVDCYSFLSLMVSPPADSGLVYLTQSRRAWDLAAATLKPLALQYIVSSLFLTSVVDMDSDPGPGLYIQKRI
jgi:hypothetical protein